MKKKKKISIILMTILFGVVLSFSTLFNKTINVKATSTDIIEYTTNNTQENYINIEGYATYNNYIVKPIIKIYDVKYTYSLDDEEDEYSLDKFEFYYDIYIKGYLSNSYNGLLYSITNQYISKNIQIYTGIKENYFFTLDINITGNNTSCTINFNNITSYSGIDSIYKVNPINITKVCNIQNGPPNITWYNLLNSFDKVILNNNILIQQTPEYKENNYYWEGYQKGRDNILNNPNSWALYTTNDLMDAQDEGETIGQNRVISNPNNYELYTKNQYDQYGIEQKDIGYNNGIEETGLFNNIFSSAFTGFKNIIEVEIFPGITLGLIVGLPLMFTLITIILKLAKG